MECRNHHAKETQLSAAKRQQQQMAREVSKEMKESQLQKHAIETAWVQAAEVERLGADSLPFVA